MFSDDILDRAKDAGTWKAEERFFLTALGLLS
jgi:hypothetical protein